MVIIHALLYRLFLLFLGSDCPDLKHFKLVKGLFATNWFDVGLELLDSKHQPQLRIIRKNKNRDVSEACEEMLELWIDKKPEATWNQLIKALRAPGIELNTVANEIETMLESPNEGKILSMTVMHY